MSTNDTVNLNDMMEDNIPESATYLDLTANNVTPSTPKMAVPVQSGPVDVSTLKPLDVNAVLPKKEKVNPMEEKLMSELDMAVERECESITQRVEAIREAQERELESKYEDNMNVAATPTDVADNNEDYGLYDDLDDVVDNTKYYSNTIPTTERAHTEVSVPSSSNNEDEKENVTPAKDNVITLRSKDDSNTTNILDNVKDSDLFDDDDEVSASSDREDSEALLKDISAQVKSKITPIKNVIDLSKFTIAQKAVSAQKVMKLAVRAHQNIADWVMYSANRPVSVTGLSGPEILKLNPDNSNRNRLNTFRDMYRIIYDHIYDGNKPEFEAWLKQVYFVDMQHIYFALYMATFGGSNFVNYSCPKCKKVFIKDISFEDMVTYADEETRNKVRSILKMDTTTPNNDSYPVDLVQISDSYVFALRTPSVWNVIIETASLSDQFLEKHADLIDVVSYIDAIYLIDTENNSLVPVDTKPDPNDQAKTTGRRIKAFYDIISTLSTEEYYSLRAKITEYDKSAENVKYQIPACTCPDCATEIPANKNITPDAMLFTRHQLAAIGTM